MGEFTPTDEQKHAVDLFGTGASMKIEAGAGTGKTSTLELLGAASDGRGQYLAFNKSIVQEASRKMPENVACSTAHSLAYRSVGKNFSQRLRSGRQKATEVASKLGIEKYVVTYGSEKKTLDRGFLAGHVMRAIRNFCQSADPEPTVRHFPYLDGIDIPNPDGTRRYEWNDRIRDALSEPLALAWADLQKMDGHGGSLKFGHEHYLKLWQLGRPRLDVDFVLFDEAQDANPVMAAVIADQVGAQRVYVGDSQQAIYEFTGAVNALAGIGADHTAFLTQSFRFGQSIADVANIVLGKIPGAELRLSGYDAIDSAVGPLSNPRALLCRTNARAMRAVLEAITDGVKVHLVGGGAEIAAFARAAGDLMKGRFTSHPELACFSSWGEVKEYVNNDPDGSDLKMLVGLVDTYGVDVILSALSDNRMPPEKNADLVVSTAHKAKGREWETVKIADDFVRETKEGVKPLDIPELRLLYVAVTRAKQVLDDTDVRALYTAKKPAAVA